MRLKNITEPALEPLTLAEAKAELKIDFTDDDALITAKIKEARFWAESYLRRALISRTVEYIIDCFPDGDELLVLPLGNATAVESIKYFDATDGSVITLKGPSSVVPGSNWTEDLSDDYGARLAPPWDELWPETKTTRVKPITIRYTAGYGTATSSIPGDIILGIRSRLSDLYEVRGAVDTPRRGRDWYEVAASAPAPEAHSPVVMIGLKNRRVDIQRQTVSTDSFGDVLRPTWTTLATVWASFDPIRGTDKLIAMQVIVAVTHKIRVRYAIALRPLIDASSEFRVRLSNNDVGPTYRYFYVDSVIDTLEQHRELEILATEKIDG